jgi:hypothetical protein
MMPFNPGSKEMFAEKGRISQYTLASLTARAINWVYWEPKSRMRIFSVMERIKDFSLVHRSFSKGGVFLLRR